MKRRDFIKTTASVGAIGGMAAGLAGCPAQTIPQAAVVSPQGLRINRSDIQGAYHLIQHPDSRYPICLYAVPDAPNGYVASLMRCSHQLCETAPNEEGYICPCHGARYDKKGAVLKGPATEDLETYEVNVDELYIYVVL